MHQSMYCSLHACMSGCRMILLICSLSCLCLVCCFVMHFGHFSHSGAGCCENAPHPDTNVVILAENVCTHYNCLSCCGTASVSCWKPIGFSFVKFSIPCARSRSLVESGTKMLSQSALKPSSGRGRLSRTPLASNFLNFAWLIIGREGGD